MSPSYVLLVARFHNSRGTWKVAAKLIAGHWLLASRVGRHGLRRDQASCRDGDYHREHGALAVCSPRAGDSDCVCERERVCVCVRERVCVCVRERERERERESVCERECV